MLNKLMGINYQVTKTKSVELLYRLEKNIKHSIHGINDMEMPDKDKLYNQLNSVSIWDLIWDLIVLTYIKILYKFTYKCQYYCMRDADKIARKAYLKKAKKYDSIMTSQQLFKMSKDELNQLIEQLYVHINFNAIMYITEDKIFFDKSEPYIIYNRIRYNLWDNIPIIYDDSCNLILDGKFQTDKVKYKTLADVIIPLCKYEGNRLDGKIVNCDGPDMNIPEILETAYINGYAKNDYRENLRYSGWKQFI